MLMRYAAIAAAAAAVVDCHADYTLPYFMMIISAAAARYHFPYYAAAY